MNKINSGIGLAVVLILVSCRLAEAKTKTVKLSVVGGVDQSYRGKYVETQQYQDLFKQAPSLRQAALLNAEKKLGVSPKQEDNIIIQISERDDPENPFKYELETSTRSFNGRKVQLVRIPMEAMIQGSVRLPEGISHETIHAVLRDRMGVQYKQLPDWIQEGVAVWGSGQLPERTQLVIASRVFYGGDPNTLINGLDKMPHTLSDYLEDALVFQYVEDTYGIEKLQEILRRLAAGEVHPVVFAECLKLHWQVFQNQVRKYSQKYIEESLTQANYKEYYEARKSKDISALQRFVEDYPDSFLVPNARYGIAYDRFDKGQYESAVQLFRDIRKQYPYFSFLQDDAYYNLGRSYLGMGKADEARKIFKRFLRLYSESHVKPRVQEELDKLDGYAKK